MALKFHHFTHDIAVGPCRQASTLPGLKKLTLGGIDIPKGVQRELSQTKNQRTEPSEQFQKRIRA